MPRTDAASGPPWSSRPSAASRISSSVRARRGPRRRGVAGADIGADYPLDVTGHTVERSLHTVQILYAVQGALDDHLDHGPGPPPGNRRAVRGGRAGVRRGGDRAVLDLRLAGHPARARRCGAAEL